MEIPIIRAFAISILVFAHWPLGGQADPVRANNATAIHQAAAACKVDAVAAMLERVSTPDVTDSSGATPLHYAAGAGCLPVIDLLVAKGSSLEVSAKQAPTSVYYDGKGTTTYHRPAVVPVRGTPLHWAANSGRVAAMELLVAKGANVNAQDQFRWTPLFCASKENQLAAVKWLLAHGARVTFDRSEGSALHLAGSSAIADLLIQAGAEASASSAYNGTPLHMAANRGKKDVVALLLRKGDEVDGLGELSIHGDGTKPITPLWAAAFAQRLDVVEFLVANGAKRDFVGPFDDPPDHNRRGGTALHAAVWGGGDPKLIAYLVRKGIPVDAKGNVPTGRPLASPLKGITALAFAVRDGNEKAIKMLLINKANPGARDADGDDVFIYTNDARIKALLKQTPETIRVAAPTQRTVAPAKAAPKASLPASTKQQKAASRTK